MNAHITPVIIANELRMRRQSYHGCFLLLEGETDHKLFGRFTDSAHCHRRVCRGRSNVEEVCLILNSESFPGFVAIVDADFDHLENGRRSQSNVLLTDYHDIECMILRGEAFDILLQEFCSSKLDAWRDKFNADPRSFLLSQSIPISLLLWVSVNGKLNLKFEDLEAKEFTDRTSLSVDSHRMIDHVLNKSGERHLQANYLIDLIERQNRPGIDPWQLVCGHHFVLLLSFALRYAWGSASAQEVIHSRLCQCLRLSFPLSEFKATALYAALLSWERANPPFRVLNPRFSDAG